MRAAADRDPVGFVDELPERVILDEVQRVPAMFTALKVAVDRRRAAGRFLLTGSANVLLVPALADSLAGRRGILRLHPLAQCELAGGKPRFLDALFTGRFRTRLRGRLGADLAERIVAHAVPIRALWEAPVTSAFSESDVEQAALGWLERSGWIVAPGPDIAPWPPACAFRASHRWREVSHKVLESKAQAIPRRDDCFLDDAGHFRARWSSGGST